MSATSTEPPLVPLGLPSREQWILHHVLSARLEQSRRTPTSEPPPWEVVRVFQKLENGSLLFTISEIRRTRETLVNYLRDNGLPSRERSEVGRIVERIDDTLERGRSGASGRVA